MTNKKQLLQKDVMGRDVAIQELNRWMDLMEVPEEDRIDIDESDDELKDEAKEKSDIMRERCIKAIMKGRLKVDEEGKMSYDIKHPLTGQDSGTVLLDKVEFKVRYREIDLKINMKGIDTDNHEEMAIAYIATITGKGKHLIGKLYNTDMDVLKAVYTVFTRGDA